jgi:hypothetical protein
MLSPEFLLSLRELLRCRRELTAAEVVRLLHTLPEMLDESDSGAATALINDVVVCFNSAPPGGISEIAKRPVHEWPGFRLLVEGEEQQDASSTFVGGITLYGATPPARLAALVYELLGGRIRNEALLKGKYSPLAELDENGNLLLRKALSRKGFPDCRTFWSQWIAVADPEGGAPAPQAPPERQWRIPGPLLTVARPVDGLELTPMDRPTVPTRLVARSVFRVGRSRRLSDVPARSAAEGGTGEAIKELSRVHVIFERTANGIGLRDGNGERQSANGSAWNEVVLSPDKVVPVTEDGMLLLSPQSCRYRLEVTPHRMPRFARAEIANISEWKGGAAPSPPLPPVGAVTFRHPRGAMVVRESVWMLSALGAGLSPSGEFRWNDDEEPEHAFVHRHGAFWIVNIAAQEEVRLADTPLAPGEIGPLAPGQTVSLGGLQFEVAAG